jgi:uncharacterized protein (DUF427 family)
VVAGRVVADTRAALTLREASYPPVQYIPLRNVDTALLERTDHATYCPYKGDCAYYSIPLGGERSVNAVWTYEAPYGAVAAIKDHVAFYPDRVDAIEERPESYLVSTVKLHSSPALRVAWGARAHSRSLPPAPRFSCITAAARRKPTLSSQRYAKAVAERMR